LNRQVRQERQEEKNAGNHCGGAGQFLIGISPSPCTQGEGRGGLMKTLTFWQDFRLLYIGCFVARSKGSHGLEFRMDAISQDGVGRKYTTAHRVQAWFLGRSRDNWKQKYKQLKVHAKRLQNRVNDVTRSRESWREEVELLQAENAALREQAALKK
jgi:hypothetical protein